MSKRSVRVRRHSIGCPKCGMQRYRTVKKLEMYECRNCGKQFSGPGGVVVVKELLIAEAFKKSQFWRKPPKNRERTSG